MNEEARKCVEALRYVERTLIRNGGIAEENMAKGVARAIDLIESLSARLDQVTRERDGLQMELDELKEEYYVDIHTARDPMADKIKQLEDHIRDLTKMMPEWYCVHDIIPGETKSYIICTENGAVCTARWYERSNSFNGVAGRHALYWMPLPEPPREEPDANT